MDFSKQGLRRIREQSKARGGKVVRKGALILVMVGICAVIAACVFLACAGIGALKSVIADAPELDPNTVAPVGFSTFVYDRNGNKIDKLVAANSNRVSVTSEQIPQYMKDAVVAIEDERFYKHNGVDIQGLARVIITFVRSGFKRTEGASTITQQLLKNTVFTSWTQEKNMMDKLRRKFQEQTLAIELEKVLSKDEILVRYMNTINTGHNTLGVEAAANRYFNKHVWDLSLSECTVIAVITQNPSKWDPIIYPENNAIRRKKCLNSMLEQGLITQSEYDAALADDVYSRIQETNVMVTADNSTSSYFVDALTEDVYADLVNEGGYTEEQAQSMLYSGGLRIESTLDPDIQRIADEEFANEDNYPDKTKYYLNYKMTTRDADGEYHNYSNEMMQQWFKENVNPKSKMLFESEEDAQAATLTYQQGVMQEGDVLIGDVISITPQPQASLTIMDQTNGYIVALVGGRGTKSGRRTFNRATDATRQPGSTFKVLSTYVGALDAGGMTLATVYNDAPFNYNNGTPVRNYYKTFQGVSPLRKGIWYSMNIVTVKALTEMGVDLGYEYLEDMGITTLTKADDCYQPMALGGLYKGVTNREVCAAYASIANDGVYNKPTLYTRVLDSTGKVILDHTVPQSHRVMKESTAWLLTSAMEDCVNIGTGGICNFDRNMGIAGKTGTTSDDKDVWFAGYTPYYCATTWMGYDNSVKMNGTTGAKKLWKSVMGRIHSELGLEPAKLPDPPEDTIIQTEICTQSGKLPLPGLCDGCVKTEYFAIDDIISGDIPLTITGDTGELPLGPNGEITKDTVYAAIAAYKAQPSFDKEYFCDTHYMGTICAYDNVPASPQCPFTTYGNIAMLPVEDESLWLGSSIITLDEEGNVIDSTTTCRTSKYCRHNAAFYEDPDCYALLDQQRGELAMRGIYTYTPYPSQNYTDPATTYPWFNGTGTQEEVTIDPVTGLPVLTTDNNEQNTEDDTVPPDDTH